MNARSTSRQVPFPAMMLFGVLVAALVLLPSAAAQPFPPPGWRPRGSRPCRARRAPARCARPNPNHVTTFRNALPSNYRQTSL